MPAFLDVFKHLRPWQMGILVAVLLAAAGTTYGWYNRVSGSSQPGLGKDQQLIPVQYGNLINQVSANGSLSFTNRETLTFGSPGTIKKVLVDAGQSVKKGQAIATLDSAAVASLKQAVAQAKVDLKNTQVSLSDLTLDSAQALAQARQARANAAVALDNANRALSNLTLDHAQQLTKAQQEKADADANLKKARDNLADFERNYAQQLAQGGQAKPDAEVTLQKVQQSLDDLVRGHAQKLADALQAKANAEIALKQAQDERDKFELSNGRRLSEQRLDRDQAKARSEERRVGKECRL